MPEPMTNWKIINGECLELMRAMPDDSVDLVFCSPPYEAARTYGIDFKLKGQDFVGWCFERYLECVRVSKGLVAWVIEGQTRNFKYSAVPLLLMADLHRVGINLRKPPIFHRIGIPGSGGPDWLRNDYEFIVCGSAGGKLPWSDNKACGHHPKWAPGGEMSYRNSAGARRNQWGGGHAVGGMPETKNGEKLRRRKVMTKTRDGQHNQEQDYQPPAIANPGNVLKFNVGGGVMGHKMCHENEAPFPLGLAAFFVQSFCPPGGTVLDPFAGSGTTLHAAALHGRKSIGIDIRETQCELMKRRMIDIGF